MAGITTYEQISNRRVVAMWAESGVQFRSNIILDGGSIDLHAHSYDHVALVTQGWFKVIEVTPEGVKEYQVASKDFKPTRDGFDPIGYRVTIPAGHKHSFELVEGPGEVLCLWGDVSSLSHKE